MADLRDLPIDTRVMAALGSTMHKGIIVQPPGDHPQRDGLVCVKFTPPVKDTDKPNVYSNYLSCEADRVQLGWSDSSD